MIFTNDSFPTGLWHGSKSKTTLSEGERRFNNEFYITSSLEYAVCYSMIEPGKEAGSVKKISFSQEINLFSGKCEEDIQKVQSYIKTHNNANEWEKFDFSKLADDDYMEVFRDKSLPPWCTSDAGKIKLRFLDILRACKYDGFINYEGSRRSHISPVLLNQESIGIFDESLIKIEDYLSDGDILSSHLYKSLKEKERQYFTEEYKNHGIRQGKHKRAEKFMEEYKNCPDRETSPFISYILTEQEILGCFNIKYGLKILNYEAGSVYSYNHGLRKNYDTTKSIFANSLFSDFLKENGLRTYSRNWNESTQTYEWREDKKGKWTRDIICLKFDYGVNSFDKEKTSIISRITDRILEEGLIEYQEKKEIDEKKIEELIDEILNEKIEVEKDFYEYIKFNNDLLKLALKKENDFPEQTISQEHLRENYYTGDEDLYIKYDNEKIHYKVLYRSAGKAKEGSVMALRFDLNKKEEDQLYGKAKKFLRTGLDFKDEDSHIVEIGAYQSLIASTSVGKIQINPENILIIKDVDIHFDRNVVSIMSLLEDKKLIRNRDSKDDIHEKMINTLWDGQALIDRTVFDTSYFFSDDEDLNGYILLREHFCKMAAFCTDIKLFFKDYFGEENYDTAVVKDMFGIKHKVKDIELITTNNAMKWLKFCENSKEGKRKAYKYWCKKVSENGNMFGIVKTAHKSKQGNFQRMSYQMVNSLSNKNDDLVQIAKCSLKYLDKLKRPDDDFFADENGFIKNKNLDENEFIKFLHRNANDSNGYDVLIELCRQNPNFLRSEFFRKTKSQLIHSYFNDLKAGRIIQNAENLVIVGSPYAMLLAAAGEDIEKNPSLDTTFMLEDGAIQCYTERFDPQKQSQNEDDYDETLREPVYLAEFRSPFNARNNMGYLHNIPQPEIFKKYFNRFGRQIVAINMIGTDFQHRNNGSDQDSDSIYTTNQPEIVACAKDFYKEYPTIVNDISPISGKDEVTEIRCKGLSKDKALLLRKAIADNKLAKAKGEIGESSNKAQLCLTYAHSLSGDNSKKYEDFVCILSVLAQVAIDKAKRNFNIKSEVVLKEIEKQMNIDTYKYPKFWKVIDDRAKKRNKNAVSKSDSGKQADELTCPMNFIFELKPYKVKYKSQFPDLPMEEFFDENTITKKITKKDKVTEKIISDYCLGLQNSRVEETNDNEEEHENFIYLRSEFEDLLLDIKSKDVDFKVLTPLLIDRAFCISSGQKRNKARETDNENGIRNRTKAKTNQNKSVLLKTLYKLDPATVKKCFSKNITPKK